MRRKTTQEFVAQATEVHNGKYDYSETAYVSSKIKINIICNTHGIFQQIPSDHLHGSGCKKCAYESIAKNQTHTQTQFISNASRIHNGKYDYSKVKYTHNVNKITIICPIHGEFQQTPTSHVNNQCGCPECGIFTIKNKLTYTLEQFISNATHIHNGKYDYYNTYYCGIDTKVSIICPIHGEFQQTPTNHLQGKGCNKCAINYRAKTCLKSNDQFIRDAISVHYDVYDYSVTMYTGRKNKVHIKCTMCGCSFHQRASDHLSGCGCPVCKMSKGELTIAKWFDDHDIIYIKQYSFDKCKYKNPLRFDFYMPTLNMCVEFDGQQHYNPVEFFGGEDKFNITTIRDTIKNIYCEENNIPLLRIPYWDIDNIDDILTKEITLLQEVCQ